jgi:hypothetical protein
MMVSSDSLRTILAFGPVLALVVLGMAIALRSGVSNVATYQGLERLVSNLSQLMFRILAYGLGLLAVERFMGLPIPTPW